MLANAVWYYSMICNHPQPDSDGSACTRVCRVSTHEHRRQLTAADSQGRRQECALILHCFAAGLCTTAKVGGRAGVHGWEGFPLGGLVMSFSPAAAGRLCCHSRPGFLALHACSSSPGSSGDGGSVPSAGWAALGPLVQMQGLPAGQLDPRSAYGRLF
jgi:hypothetical protein